MIIPVEKRNPRTYKGGHNWLKLLNCQHRCTVCGCIKQGKNGVTIYMVGGKTLLLSPPCKEFVNNE